MIPEETTLKKRVCLLLICALLVCALSACGKKEAADATSDQAGNFAPETTAVVGSSLAQAIASVDDGEPAPAPTEAGENQPAAQDQPIAQDAALDLPQEGADATAETQPTPTSEPFATATPQPNTAIGGYQEVVGSGLGFRFSAPQGWENIPGKSTVCFVQPEADGTIYPARVSVTMKKIYHSGNETRLQQQMVSFVEVLQDQYDEKTFEVDTELDTETKFMGGRRSYATTYLAYDGSQEIKGYIAMTYFDKYVFCFHFQCAYEDYNAFEPAIRHMRDSVTPDEDSLKS